MLTTETLKQIEKSHLLLTIKEAAKFVGVSRNKFQYYFVETGAITPIYLPGQKFPRFYVKDVAKIPERMKERQEAIQFTLRNKTRVQITDLVFNQLQEGL